MMLLYQEAVPSEPISGFSLDIDQSLGPHVCTCGYIWHIYVIIIYYL